MLERIFVALIFLVGCGDGAPAQTSQSGTPQPGAAMGKSDVAAICHGFCQNLASAGCPHSDPVAACELTCAAYYVPDCDSDFQAVMGCYTKAGVSCDRAGAPTFPDTVCTAENAAMFACSNMHPGCAKNYCKTGLDCPNGQNCNTAIGRCFDADTSCINIPCNTGLDCPEAEECNSAIGRCN